MTWELVGNRTGGPFPACHNFFGTSNITQHKKIRKTYRCHISEFNPHSREATSDSHGILSRRYRVEAVAFFGREDRGGGEASVFVVVAPGRRSRADGATYYAAAAAISIDG